jgi:hypothetical protein
MIWLTLVLFKMMLLGTLGKIVLEVGTPVSLAALYAVARFLFGLATYTQVMPLVVSSLIIFFPAWLYLALLARIAENSFGWWAVFILGMLIGLL